MDGGATLDEVAALAAAGVAGGSIEDWDAEGSLYGFTTQSSASRQPSRRRAGSSPAEARRERDLRRGRQRISVGGRLAWVAVAALAKAAEQMRDEGSFALLDVSPPIGEWLG